MEWSDYMIVAANHSKNSAKLWFSYLRKYIDKCGTLFSLQDVEHLYQNAALTPFQRVSIKAAFINGSQTRQYIISLNYKAIPRKIITEHIKGESTKCNEMEF